MPGKFEIKKAKDGQFFFNLKAGNGEIILTSEMYKAKASALKGIESIKKNASSEGRFDRREEKSGKGYFVLKAANGEIIGKSQGYKTDSGLENGIKSVASNAADSVIDDTTASA